MGALISQAVADQLRQFPGSQDPRPSPPTLIQQVLNQPGASLPMWMAPIMERQQLLATSMDPSIAPAQRQAANEQFARDTLQTVMAFGGADITKEQRAAWEAENAAYRRQQFGKELPGAPESFPPGTRVIDSPEPGTLGAPTGRWHGVVVTPGTPEAGKFAQGDMGFSPRTPPGPDYVAVRHPDTPWWFWRRMQHLEVLPPEEKFKIGDEVEQNMDDMIYHPRGSEMMGRISEPPPNAPKPPGYGYPDFNPSDWVWADVDRRYKPIGFKGDTVRYKSGAWGGWFHKTFWNKKGK